MRQLTLGLLLPILFAPSARGSDVTSASISSAGAQGNAHSGGASLSGNGRFIAFYSGADNLVPGDVNDQYDVFVHDRQSLTTELVSLNMLGQASPFGGFGGVISSTGRCVAFWSWADDLVPNDANGWQDVFVRDRELGITECVSVDANGATADGHSRNPAVSADGRFVAFESLSSTLVSTPDANFHEEDVFVRDRQTALTERVSMSSTGVQGNGASRFPSLSADGRYVAFLSSATNLVANDTNGAADVFVHDRSAGTTVRVSVSTAGVAGNGPSTKPVLSGDGRFVAFESLASNLDPGDTNGTWDVYVHDLGTGATLRASVDSAGAQGLGHAFLPCLSHDGRYVAFEADDALDPSDTNSAQDLFLRDLQLGWTRRVSITSTGQGIQGGSWFPAISADGTTVAFTTLEPLVVPGDTKAFEDVFVNAWSADWTPVCIGDGSGTPCPCGNSSSVGDDAGCLHSLGSAGRLSGLGTPSVASDSFALVARHMPNGPVLYFQGTSALAAGLGVPFGDGLLCGSGTIVRLGVKFNALGASAYPEASDSVISVAGSCAAGAQQSYQAWYRDAAVFCGSASFNLTNGLLVTWKP